MTVSASPHFRSIPLWQVKPPKSIAHLVHIRVGKASKKPFLWEWLTSMTDAFWFHICWNVESVTWPLWYRMIYRALTPVANVFGEGTGRPTLQVDSVDQNKMDCVSTQKYFDLLLFSSLLGHCRQMSSWFFSFSDWKKDGLRQTSSSWIFSAFTLTMPSGGNKEFQSLSILVVHRFHAPIRQRLWQIQAGKKQQTKLDEICAVSIKDPAKVLRITK